VPDRDLKTGLLTRLHERHSIVCVVGLGYVGLPLAVAVAEAGHKVIGIEIEETRVAAINDGRSPVADVPSEQLERLVADGRLAASTSYSAAARADVVVIAVPTPIDEYRVPDLSAVQQAAAAAARVMKPGSLIIL